MFTVDDDMGGDDKGSDDWTGDRDMGGYSGEEGTTCPQGQVSDHCIFIYLMLTKGRCQ